MAARRVPDPRLCVMNDSDSSPINLDELRLLPDWLRDEGLAPSKQYASHDYPTEERSGRGRDNRSGGFGGRDDRRSGPPRGGGGGMGGAPGRGRDDRRSGPPPRRDDRRPFRDDRGSAGGPPPAPSVPAPVQVEFLPDERCLVSINKQIRSTHLAYPLFGLARMFLQEPARHLVQFKLVPEAVAGGAMLYQLGEDGPITLDRAILEKMAFDAKKDEFYVEETVQKEPLKGNFTNVARERLSGTLLGPTNYHAYQPALRALYDSRYSRRMSFEDFRRNIEVSTDPALIERWKEEARTTTTISTREETPTTLQNIAEARQHFRQHHLDGLLRTGTTLSVHGSVARTLPEPAMMQAIRHAHEQELRYPAQFVQLLRQGLQNAGLHIFKHRKRVVYVSLARPTPFVAHGAVSDSVKAILETIAQSPLCTRKALAERVLAKSLGDAPTSKPDAQPEAKTDVAAPEVVQDEAAPVTEESTEPAPTEVSAPVVETAAPVAEDPFSKAKAALAADLRFLVQSGHIIEFHNGTFDLPLPPKTKEELAANRPAPSRKPTGGAKAVVAPGAADETVSPNELPEPISTLSEVPGASEPVPEETSEPVLSAPESAEHRDPAAASPVEDSTAVVANEGSVESVEVTGTEEPVAKEIASDHLDKPADAATT